MNIKTAYPQNRCNQRRHNEDKYIPTYDRRRVIDIMIQAQKSIDHYSDKEGSKHGKLISQDNRHLNAWRRSGKSAELVKPYTLKQVSDFLCLSRDEVWEVLTN